MVRGDGVRVVKRSVASSVSMDGTATIDGCLRAL